MPRRTVVTASVGAALLLAGVVVVRGGTAAGESDLVAGPEPSPSVAAVEDGTPPLVLEANGFPGLRLGTTGDVADELPPALSDAPCGLGSWTGPAADGPDVGPSPDWQTNVWLVDGEIASVVIAAWEVPRTRSSKLGTWLGPTLGSPIETAAELPGARTVRHTPFGPDGVAVTVVVVPSNGVEVVFGDAPAGAPFPLQDAEAAAGRITSVELRRPDARVCDLPGLVDRLRDGGSALTVDAGGIGPVRLGGGVDQLVADGVLEPDGGGSGPGGCRGYRGADTFGLNVQARDGAVVSASVWGPAGTELGVPAGAGPEDLRAAFPQLEGRSDEEMFAEGVEVQLDTSSVRFDLAPQTGSVPDLEGLIEGGRSSVQAVTVSTLDTDGAQQC